MSAANSWLSHSDWVILHNQIRPAKQTLNEFVDGICDGSFHTHGYKKQDMEKVVRALREILIKNGKFAAQYDLDSKLHPSRHSGGGGALSAAEALTTFSVASSVLKPELATIIKNCVTTPLDTTTANVMNTKIGNSNTKIAPQRRGRTSSSSATKKGNNNNGKSNNNDDDDIDDIDDDEEDGVGGELWKAPPPTSSNGGSALPRLSKGSSSSPLAVTTITAAGTAKESSNKKKSKTTTTTTTTARTASSQKEKKNSASAASKKSNTNNNNKKKTNKKKKGETSSEDEIYDSSSDDEEEYTSDDSSNDDSDDESSSISSSEKEEEDDDETSKQDAAVKTKKNSSSVKKGKKEEAQNQQQQQQQQQQEQLLVPVPAAPHQQQHQQQQPQYNVMLEGGIDDTTLLNPYRNPTSRMMIARRIQQQTQPTPFILSESNVRAAVEGSNKYPEMEQYRSPTCDIRHLLHRFTVHAGRVSDKMKITLPRDFSDAAGDRLVLIAFKKPYVDRKGRMVHGSVEPDRWPISAKETLRLEVNDARVQINWRKAWQSSRRSDCVIHKTYLMGDCTSLIHRGAAHQTVRYEFQVTEGSPLLCGCDIGVCVVREIPSSIVCAHFMMNEVVKHKSEHTRILKRLYSNALGIPPPRSTSASPEKHQHQHQQHQHHLDDDDDLTNAKNCIATMTLRDPISIQLIKIPVRGKNCDHLQCCDLESHIETCRKSNYWNCTICDREMSLKDIVWDPLVARLIKQHCGGNGDNNNYSEFDTSTQFKIARQPEGAIPQIVVGKVPVMWELLKENNNNNNNNKSSTNSPLMQQPPPIPQSSSVSLAALQNKKVVSANVVSVDTDDSNNSMPPHHHHHHHHQNNKNNNNKNATTSNSTNNNNNNSFYDQYDDVPPPPPPASSSSSSAVFFFGANPNNNNNNKKSTNSTHTNNNMMMMGNNNNNNNTKFKDGGIDPQQKSHLDALIARQQERSNKVVRKESYAALTVKGNSKNDAIELD